MPLALAETEVESIHHRQRTPLPNVLARGLRVCLGELDAVEHPRCVEVEPEVEENHAEAPVLSEAR